MSASSSKTRTGSGVLRPIKLSPSIMCADLLHLKRELDGLARLGVDYLHVDVMDGHFVPNLTFGPEFCRLLAETVRIPLDIHLMIENVDLFVPRFAGPPNTAISFHPGVTHHPLRTIDLIRRHGARPGIVVDPAVPLSSVKELLPEVDLVCVMTVNPGYAGQKLIPRTIEKIGELSRWADESGLDAEIEADGNVSWNNIPRMIEAGARTLVAGTSSLFDGEADLEANIRRFRRLVDDRHTR